MMNQCLEVLKKDEFKKEFKQFMLPLTEFILSELKPYLFYFCLFIALQSFLLLCILYQLTKKYFIK
jgi:hypothetical protein